MTNQVVSTVQPQSQRSGQRSQEVVLRTKDLTKQFKQRVVVDRLNLDIRKGEIYGFLGPNGAGKTTTIRMLLGLITPTAGGVEILGRDVLAYRASVLPRVGALIEQPALYRSLSGRDNLRAFASALGGVPNARIDEVLEIVGLTGRQKDRVKTYSLGMKQRLGIAVALLHDPALLLLDEPANGLDPAGIAEMRDFLYRLSQAGKTMLISSHLLAEVQQICTRVAIISFGKLVAETTIEELTSGQGEFQVKVEQAQGALALLQTQSWGQSARLDEHGNLITQAPNGRGRELVAFLCQNNFIPDEVRQSEHDLEQVFLQLTEGYAGI
ncbi:MAG: ATP-binding cassette domain-containing protein [Ktedonobacteraceae bacterium]|nr:ATP-binding cassette domain-containing protein [Ktedonobacteraceae bacterium]